MTKPRIAVAGILKPAYQTVHLGCYTRYMETTGINTTHSKVPLISSAKELTKIFCINVLIWTALCTIGSLGNYGDLLQQGTTRSYQEVFWGWLSTHALMMVFSSTLYVIFQRRENLLNRAKGVIYTYIVAVAFFLPMEMLYVSTLSLVKKRIPIDFLSIENAVHHLGGFTDFVEFSWITGAFIAVVATCTWRQARLREQALQQSLNDVLRLKLDLEEQRLDALRGQLEPHFIFNCLNAISALVRADDKRIALTGLHRLSDLLRYALTASSHDWVHFEDELNFIRDYLDLQRLRYGTRLNVSISGDNTQILAGDCPPLLLQPLLENALRHDLDCHEGNSDIRMNFALADDIVTITVSNPIVEGVAANPGLGLGLPQTQARLSLIYRGAASMRSSQQQTTLESGKRFEVQLRMPLNMPRYMPSDMPACRAT